MTAVEAYAEMKEAWRALEGHLNDALETDTTEGKVAEAAYWLALDALKAAPMATNADAAAKLRYAIESDFDLSEGDMAKMMRDILAYLEDGPSA